MSAAPIEDDLVDVIDLMGNVTGIAMRSQVRSGNVRHRPVFVAVLNSDGVAIVLPRLDSP